VNERLLGLAFSFSVRERLFNCHESPASVSLYLPCHCSLFSRLVRCLVSAPSLGLNIGYSCTFMLHAVTLRVRTGAPMRSIISEKDRNRYMSIWSNLLAKPGASMSHIRKLRADECPDGIEIWRCNCHIRPSIHLVKDNTSKHG
jgi:hypothetical protein